MSINLDTVVNTIPNLVFSQVQGFLTGHLVRHFIFPGVNPLATSVSFVVISINTVFMHNNIKKLTLNQRRLFSCISRPIIYFGGLYVLNVFQNKSKRDLIFFNVAISISAVAMNVLKDLLN